MANNIGWGQAAVNNTIDWGKGKTNNAIGWGSVYSASPSGETDISGTPAGDADANAFIAAAAITDTTQKAALDKLVVDLKTYGIWTKMKAIYPFVGGTAAQHKFNLKNPLDTDAAFRLVFNGGWTHSSGGALPNGTNAYANTFLKPSENLLLNSTHLSLYSRTNSVTNVEMGVVTPGALYMLTRYPSAFYHANNSNEGSSGLTMPTSSLGHFINNRIVSNQMSYWQNGIEQTDSTSIASNSTVLSAYNIYIGAYNAYSNGTPDQYSNHQQALTSIGLGLTDTEAANYYTAVQTFQTTLSRNI